MSNIFRVCPSGRLASVDFVQKRQGGVVQQIANEFWTYPVYNTRKVNITIRNAAGALVTLTPVLYAVYEYGAGIATNYNWMRLVNKGQMTTDVNGVLDILYQGTAPIGATIYIAVLHPASAPIESFIWTDVVK